MTKPVRIAAIAGDPLAEEVANELLSPAAALLARRPRFPDGRKVTVYYGEGVGREKPCTIELEVTVVEPHQLDGCDWAVYSNQSLRRGSLAFSPRRLHQLVVPRWRSGFAGKVLTLAGGSKSQREKIARDAANLLAAEATRRGVFRPDFLAFPGKEEGPHFQIVSEWVLAERPVALISGCCLNADEERTGIVEYLSDEIVQLLCRTARAAFEPMPSITRWHMYTFGPSDYEWLGDLGIAKVLLPYMWDAPREKVITDMAKNLELTQRLGEALDMTLPFPVEVGQLSDHVQAVDIPWLTKASHERARQMLPRLMAEPPLIFRQLRTAEEIFARVQQEAFLYLLDTVRWGQLEGENRPAVLCLGLEVHGGYWAHGQLFRGPRGEFLPIGWFPQCVRQHWGPWVLANLELAKQRRKLSAMLSHLGY